MLAANWEEEQAAAEARLQKIVPTISSVKCQRHCLSGTPEAEIVAFAEEKRADLIVMASHGRTGLSRLLMGSVAEAVLRRATCPVLIVKQPAKE
jgi:universal stress protein A